MSIWFRATGGKPVDLTPKSTDTPVWLHWIDDDHSARLRGRRRQEPDLATSDRSQDIVARRSAQIRIADLSAVPAGISDGRESMSLSHLRNDGTLRRGQQLL